LSTRAPAAPDVRQYRSTAAHLQISTVVRSSV
jgi:hypothetical protein